jgi:hypothetical protein
MWKQSNIGKDDGKMRSRKTTYLQKGDIQFKEKLHKKSLILCREKKKSFRRREGYGF